MKHQIKHRYTKSVLFECELSDGTPSELVTRYVLEKAIAAGTNLAGASLAGANLQRSELVRTSFSGADLSGADLEKALASRADFGGAIVHVREGLAVEGAALGAKGAAAAGGGGERDRGAAGDHGGHDFAAGGSRYPAA